MFKKPFSVTQTHRVSGADRKKIRRTVEKVLGVDASTNSSINLPEQLDQLLPSKTGELELAKLPAPSRVVIYLLDGVPVLLDMSGKSDFVPTAMGLWSCPHLLPQVQVKHPAVSQFILSGADLMLPGVDVSKLPEFQKGQLLSICVPGNPAPIAVGTAVMNSTAAASQAAGQGKGKLIEVLQHYGDMLWQTLGKGAVPNAGFLQGVVLPAELAADVAASERDDGEDSSSTTAATGGMAGLALADASSSGAVLASAASTASNNGSGLPVADSSAATAAALQPQPSSSGWPDDMDQLLELALLQALHKSVKDADLPVNSSTLWGQHITPCRPPGTMLDVKKSSHKKMKVFLQAYNKLGLIRTKEDKHSGDIIMTAVSRDHDLYNDFRPYKMPSSSSSSNHAGESAAGVSSSHGTAAAGGGSAVGPLEVLEVFKVSRELKPIFEAVGANPDAYYGASEATDVAFEYAKQAQLDVRAPDNRTLLLDVLLCDALYKGLIKKGELYPTHIAKSDLREAFLKRMQPQTCIIRGDKRILRKGTVPTINISGERRQGNKYVTRVAGVEAFLIDPTALAAECQKKFACSTNVQALPGKNNPGQEVILQGNVIDKVPDYLMEHYQIPKKYFLIKK